jgi:HPt (histidine-containing phosphotransfer) domain-containing protein
MSHHAAAPAPVVRLQRFTELAPGGPNAVLELVSLFLDQMQEQFGHLRDALARGALSDVELIAHRCAGSSATCGVDHVAEPLRRIEELAAMGTLAGADQLLDEALRAYVRAEDYLRGYAAGLAERVRG